MTAKGSGWLGGGGIEPKGKRTHGHGHQCGDCMGVEGIRGLNGNQKNAINFFKEMNVKYKKRKRIWGMRTSIKWDSNIIIIKQIYFSLSH